MWRGFDPWLDGAVSSGLIQTDDENPHVLLTDTIAGSRTNLLAVCKSLSLTEVDKVGIVTGHFVNNDFL